MTVFGETTTAKLIAEGLLAIGDGYRAKNSELGSSGLPFARAGNIDGGFHFEGADRFPESELGKVGEKISRAGDVVFTSKGTVGRYAFVGSDVAPFVYSPQLCYWRSLDQNSIESRYLYYWLQSAEFWEQATGLKGQTDMADYINLTDQRQMRITIPPLPEQRAIAHILGTLDDKIELNRKMNQTLEAIAQAIFKSWFVDFDPVVAKAEGRKPFGMSDEIAALFPNRFHETSEGPIPEGWEWLDFGSIAQTSGGKRPPTESVAPSHASTPIYGAGGPTGTTSKPLFREKTIITGRVGTLGMVFRVEEPCWASDNTIVVRTSDEWYDYAAFFLEAAGLANLNRGSTQPLLAQGDVKLLKIPNPGPGLLTAFSGTSRSLFKKLHANVCESRTLAELRDLLLPKLLSGDLRIDDAESFLAEASA